MAWKERSSEMWSPENEGESIEGKLTEIRPHPEFGDNYIIETKEGSVTVKASAWLGNLIRQVDVGKAVRITFVGLEKPKVKGHNPTRKFKFEVDE